MCSLLEMCTWMLFFAVPLAVQCRASVDDSRSLGVGGEVRFLHIIPCGQQNHLRNVFLKILNVHIKEKPKIALVRISFSSTPWKPSLLAFTCLLICPVIQVIYSSLCFLCGV